VESGERAPARAGLRGELGKDAVGLVKGEEHAVALMEAGIAEPVNANDGADSGLAETA
jgi:hypothetical protein